MLVVAIGGLALNVLLARLLSPAEVGAYFLITSIVFIGALFAQLGIHHAIVPLIASGLEASGISPVGERVRAAFLAVSASSVLVGVIYFLLVGDWLGKTVFESPLVATVSGLAAVWIGLRALQTLISQVLRGYHRIAQASVFEGALTSVLVVLAVALVWWWRGQSDINEVLIIMLISTTASVVAGMWAVKSACSETECRGGYDMRLVMRASLPLFIVSIAVPGIAEAHLWVLGSSASVEAVAVYGAAYRVAKVVVIPLLIVNSVIPPMIAQFLARNNMRDTRDTERVLRSSAAAAGVPAVIIVGLFALAGEPFLRVLYGDYYAQGAGVLLILVAAQAVNALTGSPGVLLIAAGRQTVVMKIGLFSGLAGLTFSIVSVGSMGYVGIACGVALGMVSHNVTMWVYCWNKMHIRTHMGLSALREVARGMTARFRAIWQRL